MSRSAPKLHVITEVAEETTRTHCPYCAFQCGMMVTADGTHERKLSIRAARLVIKKNEGRRTS